MQIWRTVRFLNRMYKIANPEYKWAAKVLESQDKTDDGSMMDRGQLVRFIRYIINDYSAIVI